MNWNGYNNTIIDLSGKKKKQLNDSINFEEDDIENKVINIMEDKDEQDKEINDLCNNDKDIDNSENIL